MIILTVLLSPALVLGGAALAVLSAPSDPCEQQPCGEGPGTAELTGVGLGAAGIALVAILLAWRNRRLSTRIRIETLASGIVLTGLWLAIWLKHWS
jgi:hypothetical protein